MSPRKLSDGDRLEILELYRNTEETTSTLAVRFGVSSSTISRFLKISLSELEYEDLIQEKRLARTTRSSGENDHQAELTFSVKQIEVKEDSPIIITEIEESIKDEIENLPVNIPEEITQLSPLIHDKPILRITTKVEEIETFSTEKKEESEVIITPSLVAKFEDDIIIQENIKEYIEEEGELEEENDLDSVNVLAAMFGEDMDDDDDDDDDEDEEDDDEIQPVNKKNLPTEQLQVLPLTKAIFPRVCYLVIDRYSELITKPLREFADLGKIPGQETQQRTLPVFDNHRVAKRFCDAKGTHSARKGKVIKVPDGRILQKTSSFLHAKGISRILIDGKIYSLV